MKYPNENVDPMEFFESKSVLITGACGTIGRELAKQLLKYNLKRLRLLDLDDTNLTEMSDELEGLCDNKVLRFLIGDIKDKERLIRAFEGVDYIFHCAALKHVAIGEYNPREVILTNVIGTENVIEAAIHNNVKKVVFASSDKAVNPTNTMGASKLLGEKHIVAANWARGSKQTIFSAVRFGNVLGSRGSIIPRFKKRIENKLTLYVTDPDMTRFMMLSHDAVKLIIKAMILSLGGEILVLKMPCIVLRDLVELFSEYAWLKYGTNPKTELIGPFPGEKTYEELMNGEELQRAIELSDMYIILPHIKELLGNFSDEIRNQLGKIHTKAYHSNFTTTLSKKELNSLLKKYYIFSLC